MKRWAEYRLRKAVFQEPIKSRIRLVLFAGGLFGGDGRFFGGGVAAGLGLFLAGLLLVCFRGFIAHNGRGSTADQLVGGMEFSPTAVASCGTLP
jgi:hypothetical protein